MSRYLTKEELRNLPEQVLLDIRNNRFWRLPALSDQVTEEMLDSMVDFTQEELFEAYCVWHGLIGWSDRLRQAWDAISGREAEKEELVAALQKLRDAVNYGIEIEEAFDRADELLQKIKEG